MKNQEWKKEREEAINNAVEHLKSYDWISAVNDCPHQPSCDLSSLPVAKYGADAIDEAIGIFAATPVAISVLEDAAKIGQSDVFEREGQMAIVMMVD